VNRKINLPSLREYEIGKYRKINMIIMSLFSSEMNVNREEKKEHERL
jgi:hypothetical protein